MLSLDLTEMETEQLIKAVDKSIRDAIYSSKFFDEKYSKSLMDKIANAIYAEQRMQVSIGNTDDTTSSELDDNLNTIANNIIWG